MLNFPKILIPRIRHIILAHSLTCATSSLKILTSNKRAYLVVWLPGLPEIQAKSWNGLAVLETIGQQRAPFYCATNL